MSKIETSTITAAPKVPEIVIPAIVVTAPPVPAESTLVLAEPQPVQRPRAFYVASQWHILPADGEDRIYATNNTTADKFEGSIKDFNEMLKGR